MWYIIFGGRKMIRDILSEFNIDQFAFIPSHMCTKANERLYSAVVQDCNVIFMLFPYYSGSCNGLISAYGCVYDYHAYAKKVFSALEAYISEKYPSRYAKGFSDHSPFLECEGAARAGLGVLGMNSLLITEKYSSYVFIGELLCTLTEEELFWEGVPKKAGEAKQCNSCKRCISACPAQCLGENSREKCISSLTQKKGELSEEEISLIRKGKSIWGCDACQSACPYTKKALESGTLYSPIDFFRASYIGDGDPIAAVEAMDSETFSRYPFAWRKRKTVERNINIIKGTEIND